MKINKEQLTKLVNEISTDVHMRDELKIYDTGQPLSDFTMNIIAEVLRRVDVFEDS